MDRGKAVLVVQVLFEKSVDNVCIRDSDAVAEVDRANTSNW